jgi:hypothetical protein
MLTKWVDIEFTYKLLQQQIVRNQIIVYMKYFLILYLKLGR